MNCPSYQFAQKSSDQAIRQLIDKQLLERLALAAIAQITGVSEPWRPL